MREFQANYHTNQYAGMTPERLVLALLDGALTATTRAAIALEDRDVANRGSAVSKALAIVGELQGCLDLDTGELASNLFRLYDFVQRELLAGNMKADGQHFKNAERVLSEIHAGWGAMLDAVGAEQGAADGNRTFAEYA